MDNGISPNELPHDDGPVILDKRNRRGSEHPNFGRKWTAERREQHRQWMLAHAPNRGKRKPDEVREKIRRSLSGRVHVLLERRGITQEDFERAVCEGKRWCSGDCKAFLAPELFGNLKGGYCLKCNADRANKARRRTKFKLEESRYEEMVREQANLCAVCGLPQSPADHALCIDHNHTTGQVRGLLCRQCNFGIERLDNIPGWTEKALAYLARY